ncbi:MAG TPA: transglutaminase family protein [Verrucomicrobiae bacterium]|nr:transglutaminase family protein [Verrucomicrobiae bacterium]
MRYTISHTTTYHYSDAVSVSHHLARLKPRECAGQHCMNYDQVIEPSPAARSEREDYFGNSVTFFAIHTPHEQLRVQAHCEVDITASTMPRPERSLPWEQVRDGFEGNHAAEMLAAYEFVFDSPLIKTTRTFADYAAESFPAGRAFLEGVIDLTRRIHEDFTFDSKATTVATPLSEVFETRRGVCQDFAQLQIACLRSLGLPARYVSGYLETKAPPGRPRLVGADASHAWVSVYNPGTGWIDVDPTNNCAPADRHITLAWGRDFSDVSPIRGVILGGGDHAVTVAVDVIAQGGAP